MDVQKNYDLRHWNNKIVLRRLEMPSGEMKTWLVADKFMYDSNLSAPNHRFFILQDGNKLIICDEYNDELFISGTCDHYLCINGQILLINGKKWSLWHYSDDHSSTLLGERIGEFNELFIFKGDTDVTLNYFERGKLRSRKYAECKILNNNLRSNCLCSKELFPDVLMVKDEYETLLYLSIEKETGPEYFHMRGSTPGQIFYHFIFAEQPSTQIIKFTEFVNKTCQNLVNQGFSVPMEVGEGFLSFLKAREILTAKKSYKLTISANLRSFMTKDVEIETDFSQLYLKEDAYYVKCPELDYYIRAEKVEMVTTDKQRQLIIHHIKNDSKHKQIDKIFCEKKSNQSYKELHLSKDFEKNA